MLTTLLLGINLLSSEAHAGKCDSIIKRGEAATGEALVRAFNDLVKCDRTEAEKGFTSLMTRATDAPTLVALSKAAIDQDIWAPVWSMPGKISSYEARDAVAEEIGALCASNEKIVTFLQGAYAGLRDIDFQQWDDAFVSCESPALDAWLVQQVENPPAKSFDSKYEALLGIFAEKKKAAALPHLAIGAVKAAESGPYTSLLEKMNAAVTPSLGSIPEADRAALEQALVGVARQVSPAKAREVAERLAAAGAESAAAGLLPTIYPDRVQAGGGFLYGVAAVEKAECKGEKSVVIHYAAVKAPATRWIIQDGATAPIRAGKARLTKCTPEEGDWPVAATPEPVAAGGDIDKWIGQLKKQWEEKGYQVELREEKEIVLD